MNSYLISIENTVSAISAIDSPYSEAILESCTLIKKNIENFVCSSEKIKCLICPKKFSKVNMRNHIGSHIIKGHLESDAHRCDFCGNVGCDITLVNAGSIGKGTIHPSSHCKYFYKFSY